MATLHLRHAVHLLRQSSRCPKTQPDASRAVTGQWQSSTVSQALRGGAAADLARRVPTWKTSASPPIREPCLRCPAAGLGPVFCLHPRPSEGCGSSSAPRALPDFHADERGVCVFPRHCRLPRRRQLQLLAVELPRAGRKLCRIKAFHCCPCLPAPIAIKG